MHHPPRGDSTMVVESGGKTSAGADVLSLARPATGAAPRPATVLVVDDDRSVLYLASRALQSPQVRVITASSATQGLRRVREDHPDAVLLDIVLPEMSGLNMLRQVQQIEPKVPVVIMTAGGTSDTAIEAIHLGAYDYLLKPLDLGELRALVHQALQMRHARYIPVTMPETGVFPVRDTLLVGRSPEMLKVYKAIGRVAQQDVTVLIHGESGTGKELIARAIYQHSARADGPFLAVNCAAIPETLLESELFGHEKGSFTGAETRRIGKFEQCSGGTIFLDEVGDMSPLVQSKVLRVLQEQRFERVGGNKTIETNVRIIAATNRDLEQMVSRGEFRSDLYYRLGGFTLRLPPLRERGDDLLLLIEYFLSIYSREMNKDVRGIAPEALAMLSGYPWPGNVRELQSVLKQALLQATCPVIVPEFLPDELRHPRHFVPETAAADQMPAGDLAAFLNGRLGPDSQDIYAQALQLMEQYVVTRVLRLTEGNQSRAAKILGITRSSLRNKIRALGIAIGQTVRAVEQ